MASYWQEMAESDASDELLTMRDPNQREIEWRVLERLLPPYSNSLLDVGCGPGTVTRQLTQFAERVVGIDSAPAMLARARKVESTVEWRQANILDEQDCARLGTFDAVVSVRCLINLPSWRAQQVAIENLARLTRVGGTCILIEGWGPGRRELNVLRRQIGLGAMPDVAYNLNLEPRVFGALDEWFEVADGPLGTGPYDFLSRILNALLVGDAEPRYDCEVNRYAAEIQRAIGAAMPQFKWLCNRLIMLGLRRLPTELPRPTEGA